MSHQYKHSCPSCGHALVSEVELNEFIQLTEFCDNCDYQLTEEDKQELYQNAEEDVMANMADFSNEE